MPKVVKLDWGQWLYGAVATFISGMASAVVTGSIVASVDPKDFAPGTEKFWVAVGLSLLAHGGINLFMYLKDKPLPALKTVEVTTQTLEIPRGGSPQVTTTVKETMQVPTAEEVPQANPTQLK